MNGVWWANDAMKKKVQRANIRGLETELVLYVEWKSASLDRTKASLVYPVTLEAPSYKFEFV